MRSRLYIALTFLLPLFACSDKDPTGPIKYPDQTPPARITSLWICVENPTWADLCWYAPGDDSLTGKATAYEIRFSRILITDSTWDSCSVATQSLIPRDPTTGERFRLTGLDSGVTYFAALKAVDDIGNWSAMSNAVAINVNNARVPRAIGDLIGSVTEDSSLHLSWTVPALDDSSSAVWEYVVRYANEPIFDYNLSDAGSLDLSMRAGLPGHRDSITIHWPTSDSILFLRLVARDYFQHLSTPSNQIQVALPGIDTVVVSDTSGPCYLEWQKEIASLSGHYVTDAVCAADGGIVIVSTTQTYYEFRGITVTKIDSRGESLWSNSIGGTRDFPSEIIELQSGDLIVAATTKSMGDSLGDPCFFRLSPDGTLIEQQSIALAGPQSVRDAALSQDGSLLMAGQTHNSALAMKVDMTGNLIWSRYYSTGNWCVVEGPTPVAIAEAIVQIGSGETIVNLAEYYATGGHSYCGPPWIGLLSLWTLDSDGQEVDWTTYGIDNMNGWAWAGDMVIAPDGSLLVASWDATYATGLYIRSISPARVRQWERLLEGAEMQDYGRVGMYILPDAAFDRYFAIGSTDEVASNGYEPLDDVGVYLISKDGSLLDKFAVGAPGQSEYVHAALKLDTRSILVIWRSAGDNRVHVGKLRVHK